MAVIDDEIRTGNAMILDPYGCVLAETWKAEDEMVIAASTLVAGRQQRSPMDTRAAHGSTGLECDTRKLKFEE